jgi:hypothetical protein
MPPRLHTLTNQQIDSSISDDGQEMQHQCVLYILPATLCQITFDACFIVFIRAVLVCFQEWTATEDLFDFTTTIVNIFVQRLQIVLIISIDLSHPVSKLFALLMVVLQFCLKFTMEIFLQISVHMSSSPNSKINCFCGLLTDNLVAAVIQSVNFIDND